MSLERETLDQISEGGLSLQVVRNFYPDHETFIKGIRGLLRNGDVRLLSEGVEVPRWRWRELFDAGGVRKEMPRLHLEIADQGARTLYGD